MLALGDLRPTAIPCAYNDEGQGGARRGARMHLFVDGANRKTDFAVVAAKARDVRIKVQVEGVVQVLVQRILRG